MMFFEVSIASGTMEEQCHGLIVRAPKSAMMQTDGCNIDSIFESIDL
jgi:hypothetical protein